jgi:hypothetical protein
MEEAEHLIREAKAFLNAAYNTADDKRYELLISWAREIIEPLANSNHPPAVWLKSSLPYDAKLSEEIVEKLHKEQLEKAASLGNIEAKFSLAVELDEEPTLETSAKLFKEAAQAGHAYSMWCHGLNLISGRGIPRNEALGYDFINKSGELKFEGAIIFLAEAYANGSHGYTKDEAVSALWHKKLSDPEMINY